MEAVKEKRERTNLFIQNITTLLQLVLDNNFFVFVRHPFPTNCFRLSDGSPWPVSTILANLAIEHVEEKALSTAPNPWWFRNVDDSHVCEK